MIALGPLTVRFGLGYDDSGWESGIGLTWFWSPDVRWIYLSLLLVGFELDLTVHPPMPRPRGLPGARKGQP